MNQKLKLFIGCCCLFISQLSWAQLVFQPTTESEMYAFANTTPSKDYTVKALPSNYKDNQEIETEYTRNLSIGFGVGRLATRDQFKSKRPAISIAFDNYSAFEETLGTDWFFYGFYVAHAAYEYDFYGDFNNGIDASELVLAARYGLRISKMLKEWKDINLPVDVYGSVQIGYAFLSLGDLILPSGLTDSDGLYGGISIGAAHYFDRIGVFAEVGRTESGFLKLGASYRLK